MKLVMFDGDGARSLCVRLGLAKANDLVPGFEQPAAFEDFDALKAFQDVPLGRDGALAFETAMLRHKK
jgi:hypothetical protein